MSVRLTMVLIHQLLVVCAVWDQLASEPIDISEEGEPDGFSWYAMTPRLYLAHLSALTVNSIHAYAETDLLAESAS